MTYLVYREVLERIRRQSLRELTVSLPVDQSLSAGSRVIFQDLASSRQGSGGPAPLDGDSVSVTLTSARPAGEQSGYRRWDIAWQ